MYDLISVGRANMDLFAQQIGAEFEDIEGFDAMVGGSPTNIAIGAARLGLRVAAFTGVGTDRVGDFVLRYLQDEGVDTRFVARIPGKLTSLALIGVKPPSEFPLSFYRDDPADIHLTAEHAAAIPVDECRSVLLSGNTYSRGPVAATSAWLAARARASGARVFLDLDLRPAEWSDPAGYGSAIRRVLAGVDVAVGTEEEFHEALSPDPQQVMAGGKHLDEGQRAEVVELIHEALSSEQGPEAIILKRGGRGATVYTADERLDVPGFSVDVLNTVGAGDAFAGGLICKRLAGWDWFDAVRFGNACGAIVVTRHGCSSALPTEAEVGAFVDSRGGF